ncbi:carbon storage regulator CsrA [Thiomicrorhabdus sp. 6S3-12]|uniref:carbon storage regulator CsrA n=1 Tax=Thiomicrorhabdus sp. 6S3-12 TaxID=2819681 RepID=UPI001AADBBDA|nr:carbon storage regulator CsrA [Thiomicrorhabdus sp. 6S3-12]MBO1924454.1 carbon storage regulator CsrA [Thiomicrorhabdus sp. 6S3-12]
MLVLTRREGEALVIDGNIKVTVLSVKGSQVRVGIEAPQNIPIHREELLESNAKVNAESAHADKKQDADEDDVQSADVADKALQGDANS